MRRSLVFPIAFLVVLLSEFCVLPGAQGLSRTPILATPGGGEDYCAPNVPFQFSKLQHHGDPLGADLGVAVDSNKNPIPSWMMEGGAAATLASPPTAWFGIPVFFVGLFWSPPSCYHFQSIARTADAAGTPYFILTRNWNHSDGCKGFPDLPGEVLLVRMGSRNRDGERLRSNRLAVRKSIASTAPLSRWDRVQSHFFFDGVSADSKGQIWPRYAHPGGTQLVDGVLGVALQCAGLAGCPSKAGIALIDVRDPMSPRLLLHQPLSGPGGVHWVAITKDPSTGKYLFLFTWDGDESLKFGWSDASDLRTTTRIDVVDAEWIKAYLGSAQEDWHNWQNMQFVREPDGDLYLIGTYDTDHYGGTDYAGLFQVDVTALQRGDMYNVIRWIAKKHLRNSPPRMGDFAAGGSAYVSPTGQLIVYSVEHDPGGASESNKPSIRMGEFRNYDLDTPTNYDACHAWAQLYEKDSGWVNEGKSITFDFTDYTRSDAYDLDYDDFDDTTDSIKYRAPTGCTVRLYEHQHRGRYLDLPGTGVTREISRLGSLNWTYGSGKVDNITSLAFIGKCPKGTQMVPEQESSLWTAISGTPGGPCEVISINAGVYRRLVYSSRPTGIINKQLIMEARDGLVTIKSTSVVRAPSVSGRSPW